MMKMLIPTMVACAAMVTTALAAEDPVATRKAIMQSVGGAAALSGGMMKEAIPYNPVLGKAAITTFNAAAHSFGAFFPAESQGAEGSTAAPKIWEDMAGFEAELGKFLQTTSAAAQASGKDGPADLATFQAAVGPVLQGCKSCHEAYRVKAN